MTSHILTKAEEITSGDRQAQYGPPNQDFARTAGMVNACLGHKLKEDLVPSDVARIMILLKLSRGIHQDKEDNWVDIAGYAKCGDICRKCEAPLVEAAKEPPLSVGIMGTSSD